MSGRRKLREGTTVAYVRDVAEVIDDMGDWVSIRFPDGRIVNATPDLIQRVEVRA